MTTDLVQVDVKLTKGTDDVYDLTIGPDGDFVSCYGFDTAIIISLWCEKKATEDEVPDALKRRGWIGNENSIVPGFEIGSKLWLHYTQGRNNSDTRNAIVDAANDALSWLVPTYLNGIEVTGMLSTEGVTLEIQAIRKSGKIDKLYFRIWEATGL
jgi:phage gp46-like protein